MRCLLLLVLCAMASLAQAASNFTLPNPPGAHGVGLRLVQQYDYSRAYRGRIDPATGQPPSGEQARPIQTLIWYPAQKAGPPLNYGDYMRIAATEDVFDRPQAELDALTQELIAARGMDLSPEQMRREVERPMWAVRDASPVEGRFPVVIYAPSFSEPAIENTDLCEYLASQGYVVLASPSMGAHTRPMSGDLEGVEAQARDIEFLIGYAHSLPQADLARLAVVGFSWGGMSNVFAAARDSRIKALVSLDGSVRYFPDLVSTAKYVTPERLPIPFLYVSSKPPTSPAPIKRGKSASVNLLNAMKYSDVYLVTMNNMIHAHFSSANLRIMPDTEFLESSREQVLLAHSWTLRYVHQFLNAYLKNDAAGMAFMNAPAVQNGAPAALFSLEVHPAVGPPPTRETLYSELFKRGFEHAPEVYQALQKQDPQFQLTASDLVDWGRQLMRHHEIKNAIEIFKLATTLYPKRVNAFDSLADAYEKNQQPELAVKSYQQSLVLNPRNANALQHLKALGARSPAGP